jgi:SAM-dependent methyltransferase
MNGYELLLAILLFILLVIFGLLILQKILFHGKHILESGRFLNFQIFNTTSSGTEGFTNGTDPKPETKNYTKLEDIYKSDRYLQYADAVHHPQGKTVCRSSELYRRAFLGDKKNSKQWNVLLLGIETGRFLDALTGITKNVVGVSNYPDVVSIAEKHAKDAVVYHLDILSSSKFSPNTFSHIILEDREIYRYTPSQRKQLFVILEKILKPDGILAIRTVDPDTFDPLPPTAVPLKGLNIQNYLEKRKTDSVVYLTNGDTLKTDFTYIPGEKEGIYKETVENQDRKSVKHFIQKWYMPKKEELVGEVQQALLGTPASDSLLHIDHHDLKLCVCVGEYYTIFKKSSTSTK